MAIDRQSKIAIACVVLWIIGLVVLYRILVLADSYYPMLDATTPNPHYSRSLHDFVINVSLA